MLDAGFKNASRLMLFVRCNLLPFYASKYSRISAFVPYSKMSRSLNNDPESVAWTSDEDVDKEVIRQTSNDVLRHASEITSEIDVFDLSENYQDAVLCLFSCESIIKTLQEDLTPKNRKITSLEEKLILIQMSKDEQIASLEEKLVQMLLEQKQWTKTHADELRRLKPSS